jgi:hypothetical protein
VHAGLDLATPAVTRVLRVWRHLHHLDLGACLARGDLSMALYLVMLYPAVLLLLPQVGVGGGGVGFVCWLQSALAVLAPAQPDADPIG